MTHLSEEHYIQVGGKTYAQVRGCSPFYLQLPGCSSIFFVTNGSSGNSIFHILDPMSNKELTIFAGNSDFGYHIRCRPAGSDLSDYIDLQIKTRSSSPHTIGNRTISTYVNLVTKKVEHVEDTLCDDTGKIIERQRYLNGKPNKLAKSHHKIPAPHRRPSRAVMMAYYVQLRPSKFFTPLLSDPKPQRIVSV